jgi:hypothetical protein
VEAEWLDAAQEIDRMYHGAKLNAAAFNEPERIWSEHEQIRTALLRPSRPPAVMPDEQFMEAVARIHRKMQQAGLAPQSTGELH